jgi:hypothetical protein
MNASGGQAMCSSIRIVPRSRLIHLAAIVVVIAIPRESAAQPEAADHAEITRVVPKVENFDLRVDSNVVSRPGAETRIYRILVTNRPWLWLRAEDRGQTGWALADQVIAVDQAIEYFTRQIQANHRDAYAFVMRSTLFSDAPAPRIEIQLRPQNG